MFSKSYRLQYFYLGMCCMYIIFFFLIAISILAWFFGFFFLFFTISGTRLDGVTDGEREEGGSADVAINFKLMMISLSERKRNCFGRK